MKSILALVVLGSAVAAVAMLAKSNLVLQLLVAALCFAATMLSAFATMLSAFAWITIKFVV